MKSVKKNLNSTSVKKSKHFSSMSHGGKLQVGDKITVINNDMFEGEEMEENSEVVEILSPKKAIVKLGSDPSIKSVIEWIGGRWEITENVNMKDGGSIDFESEGDFLRDEAISYLAFTTDFSRAELERKNDEELKDILKFFHVEEFKDGGSMADGGEIGGLYDLRIGFGGDVSTDEKISRAIRDLFLRKDGKLDKEIMDKTIAAVGKHHPEYKKVWKDYIKTFEIETVGGQYVNPFFKDGGKTGIIENDILLKDEGLFYNVYGQTEKGKNWLQDHGYKHSRYISSEAASEIKKASGINVGEIKDIDKIIPGKIHLNQDGGKTAISRKGKQMDAVTDIESHLLDAENNISKVNDNITVIKSEIKDTESEIKQASKEISQSINKTDKLYSNLNNELDKMHLSNYQDGGVSEPEWMEIWFIEGANNGTISNISTSIAAAQKALASHNQHLVDKHGLGSINKARVLKKDWDADKINVSNLKKYQRELASTGPLYQDGGTFDPEKKRLEDRIRALEIAISSPSTAPEMREQFKKSLIKVQNQLADYKPRPSAGEYATEREESTERTGSRASASGGPKVVVDIDPQSQLDNANKITISVKAEGSKPEVREIRTESKTEKPEAAPREKPSAPSPSVSGNFYIDIPDKYYGPIRNVLYNEKKEGNIKTYKVKTFDNKNRIFLETSGDLDVIFKAYNDKREKKGDPKVSKADVTGSSPKMKNGGKTKKFMPVKKRVERKSVKKSLSKNSIKGKLQDGGSGGIKKITDKGIIYLESVGTAYDIKTNNTYPVNADDTLDLNSPHALDDPDGESMEWWQNLSDNDLEKIKKYLPSWFSVTIAKTGKGQYDRMPI